ncbi:MAG: hypothetical protein E7046_05730 [Lentisphaerae bacterium]|nr:hypothetical protein [Lentisphaerota bacterium]
MAARCRSGHKNASVRTRGTAGEVERAAHWEQRALPKVAVDCGMVRFAVFGIVMQWCKISP